MSFKFNALSREEIQKRKLFAKGDYYFKVIETEISMSQKNVPMIKVKCLVKNDEGRPIFILDWIMSSEEWVEKLLSFCECLNIVYAYDTQDLSEIAKAAVDKEGFCFLKIEPDREGIDRNKIAKYLVAKQKKKEEFFDDRVPF